MAKYFFEKREIAWDIDKFNTLPNGILGTDTRWVSISVLTGNASNQETSPKTNEIGTRLGGSALNVRDVLKWERTNHLGRHEGKLLENISKVDLLNNYRTSGNLIENIVAEETEYPEDGIQGNYWYVRGEKAFPSLKVNGLNVASAKIKLASGDLEVGNIYYKDLDNVIRDLK